ncbi:hypothetical protein V3C33_15245 [Micrococcaceae bacterium Sec5.7]
MPTAHVAKVRPPRWPAPRVPPLRTPAAAVVLCVALCAGAVLTGCEYSYDDGREPLPDSAVSSAAPPFTSAALPQDPRLNEPVSGAELEAWAAQVLPDAEGQQFRSSFGSLAAGHVRTESTGQLPSGTYALTLACRSQRRVSFTVRDDQFALVDLSLRCGTSRVNVVYLSADTLLTVRVDSQSASNFAYRVSRI